MNYSEVVRDYVGMNPKPNPQYLPTLVFQSTGTNKQYGKDYTRYYLPNEGLIYINDTSPFKDKNEILYCNMLTHNKYSDLYHWVRFFYARYIPEYNMLEMASVKIFGLRPDKTQLMDKREYEWDTLYFPRIFIFKDTKAVYDEKGQPIWVDNEGRYYNRTLYDRLKNVYNNLRNPWFHNYSDPICKKEFNKFLESAGVAPIKATWYFGYGYRNLYPRKESEKAKKFAPSYSATLKDIAEYQSICEGYYRRDDTPYWVRATIIDENWVGEKVDNDTYVLRKFKLSQQRHNEINDTLIAHVEKGKNVSISKNWFDTEFMRIFIKRNGEYSVQINGGSEWFKSNIGDLCGHCYDGTIHYSTLEVCDFLKDEVAIIKELDTSNPKTYSANALIKLLVKMKKSPMIKQLKSEGLNNLFEKFAIEEHNQMLYCKSNSKDLFKYTGLNKEQLQLLDKTCKHLDVLSTHATITTEESDIERKDKTYYRNRNSINTEILQLMFDIFGDTLSTLNITDFNIYYRRIMYMICTSGWYNWRRKFFGEPKDENTDYIIYNVKKMINSVKEDNGFFCDYLTIAQNYFNSKPRGYDLKDQSFFNAINVKADLAKF